MKFDHRLCCPGCGAMFLPADLISEICPDCEKEEQEKLAAIAHELEPKDSGNV